MATNNINAELYNTKLQWSESVLVQHSTKALCNGQKQYYITTRNYHFLKHRKIITLKIHTNIS